MVRVAPLPAYDRYDSPIKLTAATFAKILVPGCNANGACIKAENEIVHCFAAKTVEFEPSHCESIRL